MTEKSHQNLKNIFIILYLTCILLDVCCNIQLSETYNNFEKKNSLIYSDISRLKIGCFKYIIYRLYNKKT